MSRRYFGTDGVRGRVGAGVITPDFVLRLGYAAGKVLLNYLPPHRQQRGQATVLIGKDTRVSGYMLESALEAGFSAAGANVLLVGPMPTPGVAYLTRALRLQAGVVISASHNPYYDNGIKFFSASGNKLPDDVELAIEAALDNPMHLESDALGKVRRIDDAAGRYIEFCKSTFPNELDLRGLRLVLDCANGATYHIAPHVFHELGAEVITIGNQPDGFNINREVGATHPQTLQQAVKLHQADLGIAFDGDGDRLIFVDAQGQSYDGDVLVYLLARAWQSSGRLKGGVVGTLMTNYAVENALAHANIPFVRAKVGDRYVLEQLQQQQWQLGGEGSGHLLCLDRHTTGDGIVSALQILEVLQRGQLILAQAVGDLVLYPQVLLNVPRPLTGNPLADTAVMALVAQVEKQLQGRGRVLLRPSGTEPLIRVMVEADDAALAQNSAQAIAQAITNA